MIDTLYIEPDSIKIEKLKKKIRELEKTIEDYKRCNRNILRVYKERENAKRGLYPKKEHTGYLLLSSNPIDYKFYHDGVHKIEKIYQHVFQTPYTLDLDYFDVYNSMFNDITHKDKNGFYILKELSCKRYNFAKRYEELIDDINTMRNKRFHELIEKYRKENGCYDIGIDEENKLHDQAYTEELYFFFNIDIRMNGKEGYWEVIMQSTCPLPVVPKEMRFRKGNKDETKSKDV